MICRGKSKTDGEWVKGYLVKYQPTAGKDKWIVGIVPEYASALYIIEVIPETIGECSEQKSSKGNEIFVGDLVKHHFGEEIGVVKFGEYRNPFNDDVHTKHIGFFVDWISGECKNSLRKDLGYWINIENNYDYKVFIGNIHDNPELLKIKEERDE